VEIDVRVIEQQNLEWTTIILINDTCAGINEILYRWRLEIV